MFIDPNLPRTALRRYRSIARGPRDPSKRLLRAVLELAGPGAVLLRHGESLWLSATFVGARHNLTLAFEGDAMIEAGERFIAELPDREFTIKDWLVADASVVGVEHDLWPHPRLVVEANFLLLEEG